MNTHLLHTLKNFEYGKDTPPLATLKNSLEFLALINFELLEIYKTCKIIFLKCVSSCSFVPELMFAWMVFRFFLQ